MKKEYKIEHIRNSKTVGMGDWFRTNQKRKAKLKASHIETDKKHIHKHTKFSNRIKKYLR
jgi:hypothetical protein